MTFEIVGVTEVLFFATVGNEDDGTTVIGCSPVGNVGLVLPIVKRLLGVLVVGTVLNLPVEGLVDIDGPALSPVSFVGPTLLIDDGENDTEALGNFVDGVLDAFCGLGVDVTGSPDEGGTEVNGEGIVVDTDGALYDGDTEVNGEGIFDDTDGVDDGGTEVFNDEGVIVDADGVLVGRYVGDSVSTRSTTRLVQYTSANTALASTLSVNVSSPSNWGFFR